MDGRTGHSAAIPVNNTKVTGSGIVFHHVKAVASRGPGLVGIDLPANRPGPLGRRHAADARKHVGVSITEQAGTIGECMLH